jgi:hypothetical protein
MVFANPYAATDFLAGALHLNFDLRWQELGSPTSPPTPSR